LRYMDKWSESAAVGALHADSTFHAPVYKYDYMTKDYCLGSMQGGIVQPIQQQSWSLVFNSDKPHNIITGLHPYVSAEELGMFFPEYPSFQLERIGQSKASYTSENKWVGGSPYERIYQDKNMLVALYDLPDSVKYHHVDIFIPWGAHPLDSTKQRDTNAIYVPNWTIYKFDSTRIAIYPLSDYREFKEQYGVRLRMSDAHSGYVIYCSRARDIDALHFMNKFIPCDLVRDSERIYSKKDNGKTINISLNPKRNNDWLFRSPFLESKKGGGILTMRYKGKKRILDFNN
ncbi:MAG TPA: hypothetical protein VG537_04140, partial [Candidatus Kapabacteria bacterium]|nr:hypothetical protein [Candidatus Kapabacteria bacterium]